MHRKRSIINFRRGILTYKLSFFLLFLSSIQLIAKDITIIGSAEDYKTYPPGIAAEFRIPVLAKNFTVPKSWQLLATAQDGDISQFSIQGDWLAWSEKRLDPKTEGNRAESFFVRLYRKRIDSNEIETLRAPKYSNPWGEHFVLGDNGIVSYDYRGDSLQTLYVPGQKPFALHNEDYYGTKYTPIKIYQNALFCVSKNKRVSLIPFDGKPPDLKRIIRLEIEKDYYDRQAELFWDGKHILYTEKKSERNQTARKFPRFISRIRINLFDTERKKTIWKDERILPENIQVLDLNSKYAYYYVNCEALIWNFKEKIFRHTLKEPGKTEHIILPFTIPGLVDFSQERLLCIIRHPLKKDENRLKCFAAEIDFKTGSIDTFDIPLSLTNGLEFDNVKQPIISVVKGTMDWDTRRYDFTTETWLPMTGDAKFSRLIVVFNNKIYLVPKIKTEEIEGLDWQPVVKEKEK